MQADVESGAIIVEGEVKGNLTANDRIELKDSANTPANTWELRRAMPTKWSITSFDSQASAVATETLEFIHNGFLDD